MTERWKDHASWGGQTVHAAHEHDEQSNESTSKESSGTEECWRTRTTEEDPRGNWKGEETQRRRREKEKRRRRKQEKVSMKEYLTVLVTHVIKRILWWKLLSSGKLPPSSSTPGHAV